MSPPVPAHAGCPGLAPRPCPQPLLPPPLFSSFLTPFLFAPYLLFFSHFHLRNLPLSLLCPFLYIHLNRFNPDNSHISTSCELSVPALLSHHLYTLTSFSGVGVFMPRISIFTTSFSCFTVLSISTPSRSSNSFIFFFSFHPHVSIISQPLSLHQPHLSSVCSLASVNIFIVNQTDKNESGSE